MSWSRSDVEILWDDWGVPHIYGASIPDAYFGLGWAQAQAHGDLLLRLYGQARGRAAEYWGEPFADGDRLVRRMGLPDRGREWLTHQSAEFSDVLTAFTAGVNAGAARDRAAVSDRYRVVLPVEPADVLRHGLRDLLIFLGGELVRSEAGLGLPTTAAGSNGWAVAPSRTLHGNAMLLLNPHLTWGDLFTYFEAHLVAEDLDFYGAALVGNPVLSMGFNDRLGWTHTVNTHHAFDRFLLTPDGDGYLLDGVRQAYEQRTEQLLIREPDGSLRREQLTIRRSCHGPVLGEHDGRPVAARVAAIDIAPTPGMFEQWHQMCRARDLAQFEQTLERLQLPMFTVIYADADGHCLSVFNGRIPKRPSGDFEQWTRLQPGDDSTYLWTETHGYHELPRVLDPPSGWVQNSNSPPWLTTVPSPLRPEDFPAYFAPAAGLRMREQRAIQLLTGAHELTLTELVRLKHDTRMLLADRILEDLLAAANGSESATVRTAAEVLAAWDRHCDTTSRGAVLFVTWAEQLMGSFQTWWPDGLFAEDWDERRPIETPCGLADPAAALVALEDAAGRVKAEFGCLDVPWGKFARLRLAGTDLPGTGCAGDPWGVFSVINYAPGPDRRWTAWGGDTITLLVEFSAPPQAVGVLSYGNSSRTDSPHVTDQLALVSGQQVRPVWRRRADVEAHLERRERPGCATPRQGY